MSEHPGKQERKPRSGSRSDIPGFYPITRGGLKKYHLPETMFDNRGRVVLPDSRAIQAFASSINRHQSRTMAAKAPVTAGQLNAAGLIYDIFSHLFRLYADETLPHWQRRLRNEVKQQIGKAALEKIVSMFSDHYFGAPAASPGKHRRPPAVEVWRDILLNAQAHANPSMTPYHDLMSRGTMQKEPAYKILLQTGETFFKNHPPIGPEGESLLEMISAPARSTPGSIAGQLEYIKDHWHPLIGPFLNRLLRALDLLREEETRQGDGKGSSPVISIKDQPWWRDAERFSPDSDWMPRVVLVAKNVHVWLDQLSRRYGSSITTLDQIPDAELDELSGRGFTALWLIGLWQRSPASQRIKNISGNPEAMASAYAVFDYKIASDLGGDEALQDLKERALQRNILLASDMVPNHMGLDSPWVIDHPEQFIHLDHSPFPNYTFTGTDLSRDPRVALHLEDHYYDRSDAAVVFRWTDRKSGRTRFIYHGNDGTSMPWNDTAQLNHLLPEVRERLIQTIISVARQFPIIRFDAAMTLTKMHYQRLWYPEPGQGGDIPSRSAHGLSDEGFHEEMPEEFWRQVVDRMAAEAPGTLLLAEAFWLMESFFVRNLGMHRVYNSAFMNFLRDEKNGDFRLSIKNVLSFNPEILKRFVNFMNNPDEETAVAQFGKGDKYFGICTLMVTLPGLAMFGHGQVEGFEEKYGMEYRRAYRDESPDPELVLRHERHIFPLMRRRDLFAGVTEFRFYDFRSSDGNTNEDVIAFSNRRGDEACLVIHHNRYNSCAGRIKTSVPFTPPGSTPNQDNNCREDIIAALGFSPLEHNYIRFKDQIGGQEYIRDSRDMAAQGLYFELNAYRTHVFLDFRVIKDYPSGIYGRLCRSLDGKGVDSLDEILRKHYLNPLFQPLGDLLSPPFMENFMDLLGPVSRTTEDNLDRWFDRLGRDYLPFLEKTWEIAGWRADAAVHLSALRADVDRYASFLNPVSPLRETLTPDARKAILELPDADRRLLLLWLLLRRLDPHPAPPSRAWDIVDHWGLTEPIAEALAMPGTDGTDRETDLKLFEILLKLQGWWPQAEREGRPWIADFLHQGSVSDFVGTHHFEGRLWFHKESAERLIRVLGMTALLDVRTTPAAGREGARAIKRIGDTVHTWLHAVPDSGFHLSTLEDKMVQALKKMKNRD